MEIAIASLNSRERMVWASRVAPGELGEYDANTLSGDYLHRLSMVGTPVEMIAGLANAAAFMGHEELQGLSKRRRKRTHLQCEIQYWYQCRVQTIPAGRSKPFYGFAPTMPHLTDESAGRFVEA